MVNTFLGDKCVCSSPDSEDGGRLGSPACDWHWIPATDTLSGAASSGVEILFSLLNEETFVQTKSNPSLD